MTYSDKLTIEKFCFDIKNENAKKIIEIIGVYADDTRINYSKSFKSFGELVKLLNECNDLNKGWLYTSSNENNLNIKINKIDSYYKKLYELIKIFIDKYYIFNKENGELNAIFIDKENNNSLYEDKKKLALEIIEYKTLYLNPELILEFKHFLKNYDDKYKEYYSKSYLENRTYTKAKIPENIQKSISNDLSININNDEEKKYIKYDELIKYFKNANLIDELDIITEVDDTKPGEKKIKKPYLKDKKLSKKIGEFNEIKSKIKKGITISSKEKFEYDNFISSINNLEGVDPKEKEILQKYIQDSQEQIVIDEDKVIDTTKTIIHFKSQISNMFRMILIGLTIICILSYIFVLLISIYNVFNLILKIIINIINLFYNVTLTNNDTLSYNAKSIIRCTKDNYDNDIFNILNEQFTAITVFNTSVYMIYILLAYIILYIILIIFTNINSKTYLFEGNIKDIDPNFELLTIIGLIFLFSFIHLLIYKFLFKSISLSKFREINSYEYDIDKLLSNQLSTSIDINYYKKFYKLLTDTSKRNEIDSLLSNMVLELQEGQSNQLEKYLLIYNLYIYFEDYVFINDIRKIEIKKYLDNLVENKQQLRTFISFLDINERKLIKLSHEELPFYNSIPSDKIEIFKLINMNVSDTITNINKSIIKYSGTFYPFLFICIYILIICIFNLITLYIIFKFIDNTKNTTKIFPDFIYNLGDKYIYYCELLYYLINK